MVEHSQVPLPFGDAQGPSAPADSHNNESKPIKTRKPGDEFRTCSECGYEYGFHVSLMSTSASHGGPVKSTRDLYRVILVCPNCGARYDIGWKIPLAD